MSAGFFASSAAAPRPSSSTCPGRRFCSSTSARSTMKSTRRARCAGSRSSHTTERLLRLIAWKVAAAPSRKGGPHLRASSPPGFSILTTSAPRSPSTSPAQGAATLWPSSTTTMPASGALAEVTGRLARRSFGLEAGAVHDPSEALHVILHHAREFFRTGADHRHAGGLELGAHLGGLHPLHDFGVVAPEDRLGQAG